MVGRQFTQAVLMVAATDLTLRLVYVGLSTAGLGDPPAANTGTVLPLNLIGITTALLAATLVAAKLAELALRLRRADFQRVPARLPRPALLRALAPGGTVTIAWFALFTGGATRLGPLRKPRVNGPADNRPQASLSKPVQHAADLNPKSSDQEESSEDSNAGRRTPAPTPE